MTTMIGQKFGRLTVITENGSQWFVRCDCGVEKTIARKSVLRKDERRRVRSCGCFHKERVAEQGKKNARHGMKDSPTWRSWLAMRNRCENPNNPAYSSYGGRGITVCERWAVFENFFADMGLRPENTSIDRIDNNSGYSPDNCKWSSRVEQSLNRRTTRIINTPEGPLPLALAAKKWGIGRCTLSYRLSNGWPIDEALATPARHFKPRS